MPYIEYPRLMYGLSGGLLEVYDDDQKAAAKAAGWSFEPLPVRPTPEPNVDPAPEPLKRGPGRPKKTP